ncbi:PR domain zinc finger protein 5 [Anabrus simplex]|uniref:PR domain zinc finger protein 5 n=1 Tax=Anabrus simplex TaxID=316456 RepID=UPI0035A2A483
MSMDIKIEPVWSEEPFIVPDPGGGTVINVVQDMATQVIPSIKTEELDPVPDGEMRQVEIISDIVSDTKTEKTTPPRKEYREIFHSASEAFADVRIPETGGDSRLTQSSIVTVWIKQEAKDENEIMYDESNNDEGHHTVSHTDNIWDASTTGSADCAEITSLDSNHGLDRRKKTSTKHVKRLPHNITVPIYKLDSKVEDLNILSSCQPSLPIKSDLRKRNSQNTRVKSYVCNVCNKSFFRKAFLSRHLEGHEEDQLFFCDTCGKQFKSKEALKRHIYARHTDEVLDSTISNNTPIEIHACNVCMKTFYRSYHLKRHMLVHSDKRPYSCEICEKRFKDRHQIKAHYNIHIEQRTNLLKPSVSIEFLKNRLSTHTSKATFSKFIFSNKRERSYACNKCTKSFDRRSRLKKHMLLHTDEQKYFCKICSQRFKDQDHLDVHCNIVHNVEEEVDNNYNLYL